MVGRLHKKYAIFGSVLEEDIFPISVVRDEVVFDYAGKVSRKLEGYEVKVVLTIKADRADSKLVFTFVERTLDLGSDSFKVRNPFIIEKTNVIPLIDGPSNVVLANFLAMFDIFPDIGGNSPSLVVIVGPAVFVEEQLGQGAWVLWYILQARLAC